MRAHPTKSAIIATLCAVLAACANARADFPSLALRPFESGAVPESAATPPAPIRPPTSAARLTELRRAAERADAAFTARKDEATRLVRVAAGQPIESTAQAAALVELAALDTLRSQTASALAALDVLAAEAAGALSEDAALTVTQAQVAATLASEDAVIARLWEEMEL